MKRVSRVMRPMALALLGAVMVMSGFGAAHAAWPERPIRMIVTQAAGGTPDIICRMVTDAVAKRLDARFVIENRPGGGNVVGAQAAARAEPDGYTFLWATAAAMVTNPYTFKTLPYDPLKDFVAVGKVAGGPFILLANPEVPVKTLPELITYAKANPGKLNFATDGARNFSGMIAAWIDKLAGLDIAQVPYATMPQGAQDTVAGRVQLTILAIPSAAPLAASGKLTALALSRDKRAPGFENLPTISETLPGFDINGWMMVAAPAATPPDIVARFNRELAAVLAEPEMVRRLAEIGFYTDGAGTPAEAQAYVRHEYEVWGRIVSEIGLKAE